MTHRICFLVFSVLMCLLNATPALGQTKRPTLKWKKLEGSRPHIAVVGKNSAELYLVLTRPKLLKRWHLRFDLMDSLGRVKSEMPIEFISPEGKDLQKSIDFVNVVELPEQTFLLGFVKSGNESILYLWKVNLNTAELEPARELGRFEGEKVQSLFTGSGVGSFYRVGYDDYCEDCTIARVSASGERILIGVSIVNEEVPIKKNAFSGQGAVYFVLDKSMKLLFQGEFQIPKYKGTIVDLSLNDTGLVVAQIEGKNSKSTAKSDGFTYAMYIAYAKNGGEQKLELLELSNGQMMDKSRFVPSLDGSFLLLGATRDDEDAASGWQTIQISNDGHVSYKSRLDFTKEFRTKTIEKEEDPITNVSVKKVLAIGSDSLYFIGEIAGRYDASGHTKGLFVIRADRNGNIDWMKRIEKLSVGGYADNHSTSPTSSRGPVVVNAVEQGIPYFLTLMHQNTLHLYYESFNAKGKYQTLLSSIEPSGKMTTRKAAALKLGNFYAMQEGYYDEHKNEWFLVRTLNTLELDRYVARFRLTDLTDGQGQSEENEEGAD